MAKYMTVVAISDEKEDKNGRSYKRVTLKNLDIVSIVDPETGEIISVKVQPKLGNVNAYAESYLNGLPSFLFDAKVGEKVLGNVESRMVKPYEIERDGEVLTIDKYSTPVFGNTDEDTWESLVKAAFKNNGREFPDAEDDLDVTKISIAAAKPVSKPTVVADQF